MRTKNSIETLLPKEFMKNTDIPTKAKTIMVALISLLLDTKAMDTGVIFASNSKLREMTQLGADSLRDGLRWLQLYGLIERTAGKTWKAGEPKQASEYTINFEKLTQPLKMKSFDDVFAKFMKKPVQEAKIVQEVEPIQEAEEEFEDMIIDEKKLQTSQWMKALEDEEEEETLPRNKKNNWIDVPSFDGCSAAEANNRLNNFYSDLQFMEMAGKISREKGIEMCEEAEARYESHTRKNF